MISTLEKTSRSSFDAPPMHQKEFLAIRNVIREFCGISLSEIKKGLLRTRLRKRLVELELNSFEEYAELLCSKKSGDAEFQVLVNCVTTNKTDFFREPHHFEHLRLHALPDALEARRKRGEKKLRIWSAGCSSGQEAYSIAITVAEFLQDRPEWDIKILASDIDTECLAQAQLGRYQAALVDGLPLHLKKKYFLRGTGEATGQVQVRPELNDLIAFRQINFADQSWPIQAEFDFIFCRNVIIYFDRDFQEQLLRRFTNYMLPHSRLFLGHSESMNWLPELEALGQTIFRQKKIEDAKSTSVTKPIVKRIVAGETFASDQPIEISTLLGSCVAACLFDPIARAGGMNHVLFASDEATSKDPASSANCAKQSVAQLIAQLKKLGAEPGRMVARLYGGAELFNDALHANEIGLSNAQSVTELLKSYGIPVIEQKIGGKEPVRISMRPDTGAIAVATNSASASRDGGID